MKREDGWVSVRIDPLMREELELLAKQEERTLNGVIRLAIKQLLARTKEAA